MGEVVALVWSQVVLSIVLPAVVIPLVVITNDRAAMGELVNRQRVRRVGMVVVGGLIALNVALLSQVLTS